jgi:P27 family predicted phage terminase small subunit
MGGRPKLPPNERKLRGDAGKRTRKTKAKSEPQAEAPRRAAPDPPPWLTDPVALGEWRRLAPELMAMRVLTELDVNDLAQYCLWFGVMLQAQADVAKHGITTTSTSKHGELKRKNPALAALKDASKEMKALADQLGLGPLARFKLGSAAANNGQQLELPGFSAAVQKTASPTNGPLDKAKDEAAEFFGYH